MSAPKVKHEQDVVLALDNTCGAGGSEVVYHGMDGVLRVLPSKTLNGASKTSSVHKVSGLSAMKSWLTG